MPHGETLCGIFGHKMEQFVEITKLPWNFSVEMRIDNLCGFDYHNDRY